MNEAALSFLSCLSKIKPDNLGKLRGMRRDLDRSLDYLKVVRLIYHSPEKFIRHFISFVENADTDNIDHDDLVANICGRADDELYRLMPEEQFAIDIATRAEPYETDISQKLTELLRLN